MDCAPKLDILRGLNLTGIAVAINFVLRILQPCKERVIPAYEFAREAGIAWEAPEKLMKNDAYARVGDMFMKGTKLTNIGMHRPYSVMNPPPQVWALLSTCFDVKAVCAVR